MNQPVNRPSWLSVAVGSLVLTAATYGVTIAVNYGKQETAISSLSARIEDLNKDRERMDKIVDDWGKAYEGQQSRLQASMAQLQALQNDRCTPLVDEVSDLKDSINFPFRGNYSERDIANLQEVLKGYQASLQACYGSRS